MKLLKVERGESSSRKTFVYSIKRLADPKLQALGWWIIDGKIKGLNEWRKKHADLPKVDYAEVVEGLQATDKYTLQFKLTRPFPQFLYSLAMPFTFVVAKEVVEHYGKEFINHPVGTGPFVLPKFNQTNKIIYTKNPSYRDKYYPSDASEEFKGPEFLSDAGKKIPFVEKVIVNIMVEDQPRWLNFQKGNIDYLTIPKDNFDAVVTPSREVSAEFSKKGITLEIRPSLDVTYVAFNHDNKLFSNVKLRRAMALAYDVNKANELFYNGTALPAQSIVPPGIKGYVPSYKKPLQGKRFRSSKENVS